MCLIWSKQKTVHVQYCIWQTSRSLYLWFVDFYYKHRNALYSIWLRACFPVPDKLILSCSQRTGKGYRCAFSTFTDFYINTLLPALSGHSHSYRRKLEAHWEVQYSPESSRDNGKNIARKEVLCWIGHWWGWVLFTFLM